MWVQSYVTVRLVKVLAKELGWSLAPGRDGSSELPHHKNPARSGLGEGWLIYPPYPMGVPRPSQKRRRLHPRLVGAGIRPLSNRHC